MKVLVTGAAGFIGYHTSMYLLRRGDEVITPPNSFIASTAVIVHLGAKPIFVDVKKDQNIDENKIEEKITNKTKAIMPVHLTGRMCAMDKIINLAKKNKIYLLEDCMRFLQHLALAPIIQPSLNQPHHPVHLIDDDQYLIHNLYVLVSHI